MKLRTEKIIEKNQPKLILRKKMNKINKSLGILAKGRREYIITIKRNKRKISKDLHALKTNKEIL